MERQLELFERLILGTSRRSETGNYHLTQSYLENDHWNGACVLLVQCSFHKCDRVVQNNVAAVKSFGDRYANPGTSYVCFSDPSDPSYVIVDVVKKTTVIHCMFWPLLSLVVGLSIVLIYVFRIDTRHHHREENDTSSPLPSSLERRLVRVGDRTMILSSEEQAAQ